MSAPDTPPRTPVSIARCRSYDTDAVLTAMRTLLAPLGGMEAYVSHGMRVLLKPNILSAQPPACAATTHPAVVEAAIILVREAGGIPCVGDSPGVGDVAHAVQGSGIGAICEKHDVPVANFTDAYTCDAPDNAIGKKLHLAVALKEIDCIITLPKLKTHVQMLFTGALKNQFGLLPGLQKGQYHFRLQTRERLADLMIDINRIARPVLAIMDAIVAMEGNGPGGGEPREIGALLASPDLTALDVIACDIIGQNPYEVPLIAAARRAQFGETERERIDVIGCTVKDVHVPDFVRIISMTSILSGLALPQSVLLWIARHGTARPRIIEDRCIHCYKCRDVCPVTPPAIDPDRPRKARVNDATCIRCYCCHEFCPVKALRLRKSFLDYAVIAIEKCGAVGRRVVSRIARI